MHLGTVLTVHGSTLRLFRDQLHYDFLRTHLQALNSQSTIPAQDVKLDRAVSTMASYVDAQLQHQYLLYDQHVRAIYK